MAIAFRSIGATSKTDVAFTGSSLSVALPAGHVSGDALVLFVLTDGNSNTTATPSGWGLLSYITNGTSTQNPYAPKMQLKVFSRIDNGSLGSSVGLTFSTSTWPAGSPYVVAFVAAYSGCDPTGPVEKHAASNGTPGTTTVTQPQMTTATTGDWLLTYCCASSDSPAATFTCSVGTDSERVDDSLGGEIAAALYDSNTSLTAGTQTQRVNTLSRAATYGAMGYSLVLKPPSSGSATTAAPPEAGVVVTAYNPAVITQDGPWDLCGAGGLPQYQVAVDWDGDGIFTTPGPEDVTPDIVSDVSVTYGRDQERQLAPAAVGSASFSLNNAERTYSPENAGSPLSGDIDPARTMRAQVVWNSQTYPLFRGRIDDFTLKADFSDRTVDLTFLDGMNDLSGNTLSTGVYASMRTGALINTVLDEAGWTGGRDIDPGATIVKYWWADGTDALTAIQDLVKSEGPPSVAYVAPDGTFTFRDRHHRLLRQDSRTEQAYFHAGELGECTASGVPQGALSLARPFVYAHGWKDIVNSVTFDVSDRAPSGSLGQVWEDTTTYTLALGQSLDLTVSSSDPFVNAVTPVLGTDVVFSGAGTVGVLLSRTSGASARLTLLAIGGSVTITSVQVRAQLLSVQQTYRVSMTDAGSITRHGERTYPSDAPWASAQDAQAIANMVLLHYATRRPTVQIRVVSSDPAHFAQVLGRTVSDRVRIVNEEMGLDDDFFVERVTHTVQRIGAAGRAPVHAVVLGCEKDLDAVANPFTFDKRGAGFDQGVFDPLTADDPAQVFIFDDPVQGVFDTGEFGT